MHKVVKAFTDMQDENHVYNVGDDYPRKGATVTDERIAELSGNHNRVGCPLIVKEPPKTRRTAKK